MRRSLIFRVLILVIGISISSAFFWGELGNKSQETYELQPYESVKTVPTAMNKAEKDPYVYITKNGNKYHKEGCSHLKKSKIRIRLSEAKRRGYKPCSRCNPPQ
jgi:hypothetical protein